MSLKKIYLTVDTECHSIDLQNKYIWGNIKGEPYGLERILILGKEFNIPINFFVDIAECKRYGVDFVRSICELITKYGQTVYIHLHPNYISGDDSRTFLWQYSKEEQKQIIDETLIYFKQLFPEGNLPAFRAGRYGVDNNLYDVLFEAYGGNILDLSYCCHSHKMCHVSTEDIRTENKIKEYRGCMIFPNTRYIGYNFAGKKHYFNIDTAETTLGEFKSLLKQNRLENITLTMHSWNFIKSFYFLPGKIWPHNGHLKKFKAMIRFAQQNGYEFGDICRDFTVPEKDMDQVVDLCSSARGKIKSLYYNFIRFQDTARLSSKYFRFYALIYCIFSAVIVIFVMLLLML